MSYCRAIQAMDGERKALHARYHDAHYGFPIHDDDELFGRLLLEINQAGLSWETMLKKEASFRKAYSGFQIAKVARYGEKDRARLLADAGIIRNGLKINAAIENAKTLVKIQKDFGSFAKWLEQQNASQPSRDEWTKLFKKTFRFTGGEIVWSFLLSIGYAPGAHDEDCPIYAKALKAKPMWSVTRRARTASAPRP